MENKIKLKFKGLFLSVLGVLIVTCCALIYVFFDEHMNQASENNIYEQSSTSTEVPNVAGDDTVFAPEDVPEPIGEIDPTDAETSFNEITTYNQFLENLKERETTILVLGRTGCHYCDMYKPILTKITTEHDVKISYIDAVAIDSNEYNKIASLGLVIPTKCVCSNTDTTLGGSYGTPVTLFIKNNQTYDCMRGYTEESELISKLRSLGLL